MIGQRDGVHAVTQSSWRRPVIEDMSEMRAAARAGDFHPEDRRNRALFVDCLFADWLPETRPAGSGIKFVLCVVERIAAGGANVSARAVLDRVSAQRRSFGPRLPHDIVLSWRKDCLPIIVRQVHFLVERNASESGANFRGVDAAGGRARTGAKGQGKSDDREAAEYL